MLVLYTFVKKNWQFTFDKKPAKVIKFHIALIVVVLPTK